MSRGQRTCEPRMQPPRGWICAGAAVAAALLLAEAKLLEGEALKLSPSALGLLRA